MIKESLQDALLTCVTLVQGRMADFLPKDFPDSKLVEAMRYSSLSDGKRVRPFLLINSASIFGIDIKDALDAAVAIEFIHAYSLIHDDLPAMDDDNFRRGKLTCHKEFDEATAILAGDSLLTLAFEVLANPTAHKDANVRCDLISTLAKASGFMGMAGGQMMDLEKAEEEISKEQLAKLHRLKTGELFMAAAEMGAILGHATQEQRNSLRYFAHDLGLAFQIKDDILDHYGVSIGKTEIDEHVHKKPEENASIVDVVGMDQAKKQLEILKDQSIAHLEIFGNKAELLAELSYFIIERQK